MHSCIRCEDAIHEGTCFQRMYFNTDTYSFTRKLFWSHACMCLLGCMYVCRCTVACCFVYNIGMCFLLGDALSFKICYRARVEVISKHLVLTIWSLKIVRRSSPTPKPRPWFAQVPPSFHLGTIPGGRHGGILVASLGRILERIPGERFWGGACGIPCGKS